MSVSITVEMPKKELKSMPPEIRDIVVPKALNQLALNTYHDVIQHAPRRTGALIGSIVRNVSKTGFSIAPTVSYAIFVSSGTRAHLITPRTPFGVLAFETGDAFFGVGGETVFTRRVRHPGTRPNPYIENAYRRMNESCPGIFEEAYKEYMDEIMKGEKK